MNAKDTAKLANYLKSKKKVLILAGALCDDINFDGKKLLDYAAEIATRINSPIAATGNTIVGLKARNVKAAKKMWVAEVLDYMRHPWKDPVIDQKPELLVFIGYDPATARALVGGVNNAETLVLGNVHIKEATHSLPDASLEGWQQSLEQLAQALSKA